MYCPSRLASDELTHDLTCSSSRALSACDLVLKLTNAIGCKEDQANVYEHILCQSYVYTCTQVYLTRHNAQHWHSNSGRSDTRGTGTRVKHAILSHIIIGSNLGGFPRFTTNQLQERSLISLQRETAKHPSVIPMKPTPSNMYVHIHCASSSLVHNKPVCYIVHVHRCTIYITHHSGDFPELCSLPPLYRHVQTVDDSPETSPLQSSIAVCIRGLLYIQ